MQHLPTIETASWSEQQKVQELRLNELLTYMAERSPYYATLLKQQGYKSSTRFTLDDLATLPTTSKEDVQQNQQGINNILYYFGVNWHGCPLKVCLVGVVEIIRYYA